MKLPNKIFGIETKGAYERFLARAEEKPEQSIITPANIQTPEKYIILPGKTYGSYSYPDLLAAIEKSHHYKSWEQAHEELHKEASFMLTIRQYADLIELLKTGKVHNGRGIRMDKGTIDKALDEILTKRDPWRSEWLDAKFSKPGEEMLMTYHKLENGKLKEETEPLEQCLMKNCYANLEFNRQGMPTKKSRKQEYKQGENIYFYKPIDGAVAGFFAYSDGACLFCYWVPQYADPALGVRAAKNL